MNFKQIQTTILTVITFLVLFLIVFNTEAESHIVFFSDVPFNLWYTNAVSNLTDREIIKGYNDGNFHPDNSVTRAELAVIIDRLLRHIEKFSAFQSVQQNETIRFFDVFPDTWYTNAIYSLTVKKIIRGYEDGTFRPGNTATRAEIAVMLNRLFNYIKTYNTSFAELASNNQKKFFTDVVGGSWYEEAVYSLTNQGIIKGYEDTTFRPDTTINRAELSAMIDRFLWHIEQSLAPLC